MKKNRDQSTPKVPKGVRETVAKFLNGTPKSEKIALARAISKGEPGFARLVFNRVLKDKASRSCCEKVREIMGDWLFKDNPRWRAA